MICLWTSEKGKYPIQASKCTLLISISDALHAMPTDITCTPSIGESDFTNNDYTVGWICALEAELAAFQAMLDEEHWHRSDLLQAENNTKCLYFSTDMTA